MSNDVKLKVYLETSFVSYLTGGVTLNAKIAADQAYTRIWWERERSEVEVSSPATPLPNARRAMLPEPPKGLAQ